MKKLKQIKEAIARTPPERLAKIEYTSHLYQAIGVSFVCIMLIFKGYWWIIFAFIFGLGISYSQGVSAYIKYKNIVALVGKEKPKDFEKDISFTRGRSKIINYVIGQWGKWISIIISVGISYLMIGTEYNRLILSILYPITILLMFMLIYFYITYYFCYPIYKRRISNEKRKKTK